MLKDCYLLFFKSKTVFLLAIATVLGCNYCFFAHFMKYIMHRGEDYSYMDMMRLTQEMAIFMFLAVVCISYDYFRKMKATGFCEINRMLSEKKVFLSQFIVLASVVILVSVSVALWNVAAHRVLCPERTDLLFLRLTNCFLYFTAADFLGVLLAYAVTLLDSGKKAVTVLLVVLVLVSPLPNTIADSVATLQCNLYALTKWVSILPANVTFSPNCYAPYAVSVENVCLTFLWILVLILLIARHFRKQFRVYEWMVLSALLLFLINMAARSDCGYVAGWDVQRSSAGHHYLYYQTAEAKNEKADFRIEEYRLQLSFTNRMLADVEVVPDKSDLDEYRFTLYHQYKIKTIRNQNGDKLAYERDGDYITITPDGKTEAIRFCYEGEAAGFCSIRSCIYLPAYFCYYPLAGYYEVYDEEQREFRMPDLQRTQFHLKTDREVFCNLKQIGDNTYEGETDGVEIALGKLEKIKVGKDTVISPYASWQNVYGKEAVTDGVKRLQALGSAKPMTIFLSARANSARNYTFGEDWMDISDLEGKLTFRFYEEYLQNKENLPNAYFFEDEEREGLDEQSED